MTCSLPASCSRSQSTCAWKIFGSSKPWVASTQVDLVRVWWRAFPLPVVFWTGAPLVVASAQAAITPTLATTPEELTAANVVSSTIESLGLFGGPAVGGLLLATSGTVTVFIAAAGCHAWSALLVSQVRPPREADEARTAAVEEEGLGSELLAGLRTIAHESRLRLLVGLYSAQTFVGGMLTVLIVVVSLKLLDDEAAVGYLNSAVGIGGLVGAIVTAALVARKRLAGDLGIGTLLFGVPIVVVAVWPNLSVALFMLGIVGIGRQRNG